MLHIYIYIHINFLSCVFSASNPVRWGFPSPRASLERRTVNFSLFRAQRASCPHLELKGRKWRASQKKQMVCPKATWRVDLKKTKMELEFRGDGGDPSPAFRKASSFAKVSPAFGHQSASRQAGVQPWLTAIRFLRLLDPLWFGGAGAPFKPQKRNLCRTAQKGARQGSSLGSVTSVSGARLISVGVQWPIGPFGRMRCQPLPQRGIHTEQLRHLLKTDSGRWLR